MNGGWGAMCGSVGMTRNALENRIYERGGQEVMVNLALTMQAQSSTKHFAEAVATVSGGVFVAFPELGTENMPIQSKFNELYIELGRYHQHYQDAIGDDVIDKGERRILERDAAQLHKIVAELMALTFRVYCPNGGEDA